MKVVSQQPQQLLMKNEEPNRELYSEYCATWFSIRSLTCCLNRSDFLWYVNLGTIVSHTHTHTLQALEAELQGLEVPQEVANAGVDMECEDDEILFQSLRAAFEPKLVQTPDFCRSSGIQNEGGPWICLASNHEPLTQVKEECPPSLGEGDQENLHQPEGVAEPDAETIPGDIPTAAAVSETMPDSASQTVPES